METTLNTDLSSTLEGLEKQAVVEEKIQESQMPVLNEDGTEKKPQTAENAIIECTAMFEFAYESFQPLFPAFEKIYTPETREKLAATFAPVCLQYGWTLGGLLTNPWTGFLMVSVPLIKPTYEAIKLGDKPAQNIIHQTEVMQPIIDRTDATSLHNKA